MCPKYDGKLKIPMAPGEEIKWYVDVSVRVKKYVMCGEG